MARADRSMSKFKAAGMRSAVEMLCHGQQCAVDGVHPSSTPAQPRHWNWLRGAPWSVPAADLPVIPADGIEALMMHRIGASGVLGAPVARPATTTTVVDRPGRQSAYPATARLNTLFELHNGLIRPAVRALIEEVQFDSTGQKNLDWDSYPVIRFEQVPDVDVVLINHPEIAPSGAGEPSSRPIAAAIANAIFDATGIRIRRVPFSPDHVKAALS